MNKIHYHVHIYLDQIVSIPKKWKQTLIHLEKNGRTQLDKMLTRHYVYESGIDPIKYILIDIEQLNLKNILRIKIEQESYLPDIIDIGNYLEIHAETLGECIPENWPISHNIDNKTGAKFFNKRIYSGIVADELQLIEKELTNYDCEYRIEYVVYDSNHKLDAWWA